MSRPKKESGWVSEHLEVELDGAFQPLLFYDKKTTFLFGGKKYFSFMCLCGTLGKKTKKQATKCQSTMEIIKKIYLKC